MADPSVSQSDRIFDHARQAAIALAEAHFPSRVPREQLLMLAQESAHLFFTADSEQDSGMAMYQGAFLWAYNERRRALVAAPTAANHQHFIT